MAYTKKTWECGETITADALNHIEDGIEEASQGGAEPLVLHVISDDLNEMEYLDKTFGEIRRAFESGKPIYLMKNDESLNAVIINYYVPSGEVIEMYMSFDDSSVPIEAVANVSIGNGYSVLRREPPITFEALDDEYPYCVY